MAHPITANTRTCSVLAPSRTGSSSAVCCRLAFTPGRMLGILALSTLVLLNKQQGEKR